MDYFSAIDSLFQEFATHEKYVIREKIYNGKNMKIGLSLLHSRFTPLLTEISEIPIESMQYYASELGNYTKKLYDTLQVLYNFDSASSNMATVVKFLDVAQIEVDELSKLVAGVHFFDPSLIKSSEELQQEQINDIRLKIQDNLMQITKSFEWRMQESELSRSIEGREFLHQLTDAIAWNNSQVEQIMNLSYLNLLSLLATKIRDEAAKYFESLRLNLPLLTTFVHIYSLISDHPDTTISCEQLTDDVTHFVSTGGLALLTIIHSYLGDTDTRDKTRWKFAEKIYAISRDPKESFLLTMAIIGNANSNNTLLDLSEDYANLLSSLLGLSTKLEAKGQVTSVQKIEQLSQLNPLDAIQNLSELYHPEKIRPEHFIAALKKKIHDLQQLALELIQDHEIAETLLLMIQFTDFDAQLGSTADLTDYILRKGT